MHVIHCLSLLMLKVCHCIASCIFMLSSLLFMFLPLEVLLHQLFFSCLQRRDTCHCCCSQVQKTKLVFFFPYALPFIKCMRFTWFDCNFCSNLCVVCCSPFHTHAHTHTHTQHTQRERAPLTMVFVLRG